MRRRLPRARPWPPPLPLAVLGAAAAAPMEAELLQSPLLGLGEEDESDLSDWNLPLAFMKKRHCEKIEGSKSLAQSWRMKDRVRLRGRGGVGGEGVGALRAPGWGLRSGQGPGGDPIAQRALSLGAPQVREGCGRVPNVGLGDP